MVDRFHEAGIEVILDVVYNHTAEGNHLGPTICFRGIDNASYYRLMPDNPRYYMDYTGTGNTLNVAQPAHAAAHHGQPALLDPGDARGRLPLRPRVRAGPRAARRGPAGLVLRHHQPGPGDLAGEAHRRAVGRRARAATRWATSRPCGRSGTASTATPCATTGAGRRTTLGEFAFRFTGSSDLYEATGRRPFASINFVTAHDGFTLHDLVSYNEKHNEANGEDNRDGESHNRSWNCGVEGPTDDPGDQRAARAPEAELPGHPDALAGRAHAAGGRRDRPHAARQQQRLLPGQRDLLAGLGERGRASCCEFTRGLIALRRDHPVFRRRRWFHGRAHPRQRRHRHRAGSRPTGSR